MTPFSFAVAAAALAGGLPAGPGSVRPAGPAAQDPWQSTFSVDKATIGPSGRNPWFVLEAGERHVFRDGAEVLTITVLGETREVDGVTTRVVEERETRDGRPVEVSRNYFAIDPKTGDVYYFGEDVDIYRNGSVASHEGSWLAGVGGARFGLMMPGTPAPGLRHYQEQAPGVAMDRATIVGMDETVVTPARRFLHCLKVEETTPLEPGVREYKYYARGIGLVKDGRLTLVR
jgi:hypothetical protein